MSTQNIINFTNDLAAYDWSTMKSSSDVNKAFNVFLENFSNLYDKNWPFISHTINNNKKKINNNSIIWINNKIKNDIKKKKKLYRDYLTLKNTVSINRYKIYRNKINAIIRRQKNAAYKQFFCNNNCSDMWVKIKRLTDHKNIIPFPIISVMVIIYLVIVKEKVHLISFLVQ